MKKNILKILVLVVLSVFTFSCKSDKKQESKTIEAPKVKETTTIKELPNVFLLKELSLQPEGIVYSVTTKKTYVGSYFK